MDATRMFDRFVRFAQARRALRSGHFEQALRMAEDPLIREHRRAKEIREQALSGLERRARQRAECGSLSAAFTDANRLLAEEPTRASAEQLHSELKRRAAELRNSAEAVRRILDEASDAIERGELGAAEALCRAAAEAGIQPPAALATSIAARRQRAVELLAAAREDRTAGRFADAVGRLREARSLDRMLAGAPEEASALAAAMGPDLAARLRSIAAETGASTALDAFERDRSALPELADAESVREALHEIAGDSRERLAELLSAGDVQGAVECYRSLDARARLRGILGDLTFVLADLETALEAEARGDFAAAARTIRSVGGDLGSPALEARAEALDRTAREVEDGLAAARGSAAGGDLTGARRQLLEILEAHPRHAVARRELDLLDGGVRDRQERLAAARKLMAEGRLREASARLLAMVTPGSENDEVGLLLRDVRQRMDHVGRGLRSVERSLHGRGSGSKEGLVHELARLDQLGLVQTDSEELDQLRCALQAEIEGLDVLATAQSDLVAGNIDGLGRALAALRARRAELLVPDRLDARALELIDEALALGEEEVERGLLTTADRIVIAVEAWQGDRSTADRAARLRDRIAGRREAAGSAVEAAREALRERNLAEAEDHHARARDAWLDGKPVVRLGRELERLRGHSARVERAGMLARERDLPGARHALESAGPTPAFLRTRIFDLKRSLAQAEGLDHAFLLRVDDAGEFLVVRGESLTIGNLREGTADLPILADLAGCHARLRRTMSFHGGQVDAIEAERGAVWCEGRRVDRHRFGRRDRVRLGSSLQLDYELPSDRSLTAVLRIRGGFQIAGTDRVLWMKDRGRDGRILIGGGAEAHVPMRGASSEVEIWADRDGRIRVRCAESGQIDGVPFDTEHPVAAGSVVECGGITFVLQPWARS